MKKSIMILSFVLACVMLCCIFTTKGTGKLVRASSRRINNNQTIIVVGKGEVEVEPDSVQINFGLKTRADSLQAGQTKIKESFDNVVSQLKEIDNNVGVYVYYSSSYPVSEGGLLSYEFDCCLTAKSTKVDNVNDIVDTIISAGATSVHNTSYTLLNKEDSYVKALVKAKENAEQKVKAMYDNVKLVGLKEENCYSCCESSRGEKIKVCAKVKAFYEIDSLNENSSLENQNDNNDKQTSKTASLNKKIENKVETNLVESNKNLEKNNEEKQNNIVEENKEETAKNKTNNNTENKEKEELKNKDNKEEKLQENKTSVDTFNEDKVENISVSNSKNTNKNQKQISGINPENLIVKADNTLARNDDISLNEEYKEIA